MPDRKVLDATSQRVRMLEMMDDAGRLMQMGKSKLSFDFSPEWGRFLGKAAEYGVVQDAVKVAAVLSREDELCTMQVFGSVHPPGWGQHVAASGVGLD